MPAPPPRPGPHLQLQAAPLLLRDLALQGLLLLQQLLQGQRRPVQPQLLTASLQLWGRASKAVSLSVWVAVGETRRPGCLAGGLLLPPWPPRPLTPGSGRGLGGLLGRYPQEPVSLSLPLLESQVVEVAREDQGSRRTFPQGRGSHWMEQNSPLEGPSLHIPWRVPGGPRERNGPTPWPWGLAREPSIRGRRAREVQAPQKACLVPASAFGTPGQEAKQPPAGPRPCSRSPLRAEDEGRSLRTGQRGEPGLPYTDYGGQRELVLRRTHWALQPPSGHLSVAGR